MVEPFEVDGIKVCPMYDADDYAYVEAFGELAGSDGAQAFVALTHLYKILMGAEYRAAMDELRSRNGGKVTIQVLDEFARKVFEHMGANQKN